MAKKPGKVVPFAPQKIGPKPNSSPKIDVSASSVGREPALAEDDLRVAIARIMLCGTYFESWHSKNDRSYRNVSDEDIQIMFQGEWKLERKPEWSEQYESWKYRLTGADLDGDELTLIVSLDMEELAMTIITKF